MPITIKRALRRNDLEYITRLYSPANTKYLVHKTMTKKQLMGACIFDFICRDKGKRIGWFRLQRIFSDRDKDVANFVVIVDASYQGKGYGKQIMQLAIAKAKQLEYKKIRLRVMPEHHAAIALYHGAGFKPQHTLITMEKAL